MKTALLSLVLALSPLSAFANPGPIPDEIDFRKHEKYYLDAKQVSDAKRTEANRLKAAAESIDRELTNTRGALGRAQGQRNANLARLDVLNREIPALEAQNQALNEEIQRLNSALNGNEVILKQRLAEYRAAQAAAATQAQVTQNKANEYAEARRSLDAWNNEVVRLSNAVAAINQERERAENRLREKGQELQVVDRELEALAREIVNLPEEIRGLDNQIAALDLRIGRLETELNAKLEQIRPIRERAQRAETASDQARNELQRAEAKEKEVTNNLAQVSQTLQAKQAELGGIDQRAAALPGLINKAQGDVTTERAQLQDLQNQKAAVDAEIATLNQRIADAQAERERLRNEIQALNVEIRRLQAIKPRTPEVQAQIDQANADLAAKIARSNALHVQIQQDQQALAAATQRQTQIANAISGKQNAVASAEARLAGLQNELNGIPAKRESLAREVPALQARKDALATEQTQARTALGNAVVANNNARTELEAARRDLQQAQAPLAGLERDLNDIRKRRADLAQIHHAKSERLAQARARYQYLDPQREQLRREVARARDRLGDLIRDQRRLEQDLAVAQNNVIQISAAVNRLDAEWRTESAKLEQLQREEQTALNRHNEVAAESQRLAALIQSRSGQVEANNRTLQSDRVEVARLLGDNVRLEARIDQLTNDVSRLERNSADAWAVQRPAEDEARTAEARTRELYTEYSTRKVRYDQTMSNAVAAGTRQGREHGSAAGNSQGTTDGERAGREQGEAEGKAAGLLDGYNRGKNDGITVGDADGYNNGLTLPANFEAGRAKGREQGALNARNFAKQTEYPRGREARKSELLAQTPTDRVTLDNKGIDPSGLTPFGFIPFNEFIKELTESPRGSGAISRQPDPATLPLNVVGVLPSGEFQPGDIFSRPLVNLANAQCDFGYVDFVEGCQKAYRDTYADSYDSSYKAAHKTAAAAAFPTARARAFNENKNVRHKEGYDEAYPQAFSRGQARGAGVAQNNGFARGQEEGYNETIDGAKAAEFARGQAEVTEYFRSNPIIRVLEGSAIVKENDDGSPGEVAAGDVVSLTLRVANFGGRDSARGQVRVRWTALTPNVSIESGGSSDLIGIPSRKVADVRHVITARIAPTATRPEIVRLKVSVTTPDGETQETVVQVQTVQHIQARITDIDGETSPKVGRKEVVRVRVKNEGQVDSVSPVTVVLSVAPADANAIRLDTARATFDPIKADKTERSGKLEYTVTDATALRRGITVTVRVYHGRNVAARETLRLQRN